MEYTNLKEIIEAIHKQLGSDFFRQFAEERKKIKNAKKLVSTDSLFDYTEKHPSWAINKGGGTEIQLSINFDNHILSYGLGFNAQHVQFANKKKPNEYIQPFADAFVSLWYNNDKGLEGLKQSGASLIDRSIDDLKHIQDGTHILFGFKKELEKVDETVINEVVNVIKNHIRGLYLKILEIGLNNMESKVFNNTLLLLQSNYNLILTGAPGTGKTYLAREIAASMIGCDKKDLNNKDQFGFVQFHPSYDYTDFVEGLRPKKDGNEVVFERKDGIFKAFCAKAAIAENEDNNKVQKKEIDDKDKRKFVFVIDEINRGEISKIFGELFFSIDPGYREKKDRVPVKTQYQNLIQEGERIINEEGKDISKYPFVGGFYVPSNVYIIGTMNDIDRSVESMDFAFRRRFAFKEIYAKDTQDSILADLDKEKENAIRKMDNLNAAINKQEGFGPAYHIGAAYFKKIDKYNGNWDLLWENHLKGVLFEYLRGIPESDKILESWKSEFDK